MLPGRLGNLMSAPASVWTRTHTGHLSSWSPWGGQGEKRSTGMGRPPLKPRCFAPRGLRCSSAAVILQMVSSGLVLSVSRPRLTNTYIPFKNKIVTALNTNVWKLYYLKGSSVETMSNVALSRMAPKMTLCRCWFLRMDYCLGKSSSEKQERTGNCASFQLETSAVVLDDCSLMPGEASVGSWGWGWCLPTAWATPWVCCAPTEAQTCPWHFLLWLCTGQFGLECARLLASVPFTKESYSH